ncbi:MAG TPA: hypothetical protein VIH86_12250 [Puia sp.]
MPDNIPDNVFITDDISAMIKQIVNFKEFLKNKYSEEFEEDKEDTFIHLNFENLPSVKDGKTTIHFNREYAKEIPTYIVEEFDEFLKKHKVQ